MKRGFNMSFFQKLKSGLSKTREGFTHQLNKISGGFTKIDEEFLEELEALLITADIGITTTEKLLDSLRKAVRKGEIKDPTKVTEFLEKHISEILAENMEGTRVTGKPTIILVVGVNGVGKTTTIGKLGNYYSLLGYKVMFAAADTFRAGAIDQLEVWGERGNIEVIKNTAGTDPAAVVYDALQAAKARNVDILFIDTAGRLHNKSNLMEELKKIHRIIQREFPDAPHETFLVLDATTGQNAISQAKIFTDAANVTGVILTKLDGTAKGGVVISVKDSLGIPVKWIGVGEGQMDFRPFNPDEFSKALFDRPEEELNEVTEEKE